MKCLMIYWEYEVLKANLIFFLSSFCSLVFMHVCLFMYLFIFFIFFPVLFPEKKINNRYRCSANPDSYEMRITVRFHPRPIND